MAGHDDAVSRAARAGRSLARTVLRRETPAGAPEAPTGTPVQPQRPITGMVEHFSKRLVTGWVSVPRGSGPVTVNLWVGKLRVVRTTATPGNAMSSIDSELRGGAKPPQDSSAPAAPPAQGHSWFRPHLPGPRDDRRLGPDEIRTFSFRVRDIWPYAKKKTRITVRVNGQPLPIYGHGMYLLPRRNGKSSVAELRTKLEEGHVLSQWGRLQLSKQLDVDWQRSVLELYRRTDEIIHEVYGYHLFLMYGTLLGYVRERNYIGHDIDFDSAYVSREVDGAAAAREMQAIADTLIDRGYSVTAHPPALHLHDPDDDSVRIDLFHTYFGADGSLRLPFGIAGTSTFREEDWQGLERVSFSEGRPYVPVAAEKLVEHLYGSDWREPKPGFNWRLDRTARDDDGRLSDAQCEAVYWTNFYAHTEYTQGSSFFDFVQGRSDTQGVVVDIGCGDGRDSCAFALTGRTVFGLDQSAVGIQHATKRAADLDVADRATFRTCDVSRADDLAAVLDEARAAAGGGPVLFYLRFFLHSIPEDVQEVVMSTIAEHARDGDSLAAEFRTEKDEEQTKVHGNHFRRFQNGPAFGQRLQGEMGFEVAHDEEGTGLSPYGEEDPVLYRVVAVRGGSATTGETTVEPGSPGTED
jgi:hypothetical protein